MDGIILLEVNGKFYVQHYICALCDPDTGDVHYIGQSYDPEQRLKQNLADKGHTAKARWIRKQKKQGKRPTITILDSCPSCDVFKVEQQWILQLRRDGVYLNNGQPCETLEEFKRRRRV